MKSDFNFEKLSDGTYLITNYAGRYCFLFEGEFREFCTGGVPESKREILRQNYFWSDGEIEKYILNYSGAIRAYRDNLFTGTGLHIFVLTTQCNLKCVYCQASTESCGNMMPFDISEKCVDLALQSPNRYLSFEFQGGEPLLNFDTMKHIVLYAEEHKGNKEIAYNVVTNLTVLTEEMPVSSKNIRSMCPLPWMGVKAFKTQIGHIQVKTHILSGELNMICSRPFLAMKSVRSKRLQNSR